MTPTNSQFFGADPRAGVDTSSRRRSAHKNAVHDLLTMMSTGRARTAVSALARGSLNCDFGAPPARLRRFLPAPVGITTAAPRVASAGRGAR